MDYRTGTDSYCGLFRWHQTPDGARLTPHETRPQAIPDPQTGRQLRVATVEACAVAICPACAAHGHGGFASFVADLRMVYACPACRQLVWLPGS